MCQEDKEDKPSKDCAICYWSEMCMLAEFMREHCAGPFISRKNHLAIDLKLEGEKR